LLPEVVTEPLVTLTAPPPYLPPEVALIPVAPIPVVVTVPLFTVTVPPWPYLKPAPLTR
jgi:hypothetical protein